MIGKKKLLFEIINHADQTITSTELADLVGISKRTIKAYMAEIMSIMPDAIVSSTKGYKVINLDKIKRYAQSRTMPDSPIERSEYIVKKLLLSDMIYNNEAEDVYAIADELLISEATVYKDLQQVKSYLWNYGIQLATSRGKILLDGDESDKQKAVNDLYFSEVKNGQISIEAIVETFPEYDTEKIVALIHRKAKKYNYYLNHFAVLNIVMYIIIGLDRIRRSNKTNTTRTKDIDTKSTDEDTNKFVTELAAKLEEMYDIEYDYIEFQNLIYLFHSNLASTQESKSITYEDAQFEEHKELMALLLEDIKVYFKLDGPNSVFYEKFYLHINNLLLRVKNNYTNKNPLTTNIKYSSPLLFDCAVKISNTILEYTGLNISDDEIAYIVLHLGTIINYHETIKTSVNVALIYLDYHDFSNLLARKIEDISDSINIIGIFSSFDAEVLDENYIDLIVTTLPHTGDNIITVSPMMTESERLRVRHKVEEVKFKKNNELLQFHLAQMTDESYFQIDPELSSKKEIIHYISEVFKKDGVVNNDYEPLIWEREELSSTVFNQIAVPHTMMMNANQTKMFIIIFDKPIDWDGEQVRMICMFAISEDNLELFRLVFDNLVVLLLEKDNFDVVVNSSDLESFKNNILSLKR